ncbi:molybdate ABC transporter substrate-binding protein [Wenyingzhuangia sp. chi5]|uniref:Molybdate ABC transporter substrate-binding protein n=1 Tax=Wenyingzhuangia gilva TaxID=3057677 RepID=A0ABT8VT46_9FLAO|nr:molybdate ABC transporter substrate-binding protein [Wenyingzhuangia sp. chi5]MDO3695150.1 molybdate ABC transporter substrate-binding protein [Wenyingzhuangia sp. chi5]
MQYKFIIYLLSIFGFLLVSGCDTKKEKDANPYNKITIATAANMQFAMKKIASVFEKDSGVKCNMVISSSGKLTAQIKKGAPYDIFVAANMKYPEEIYKSGLSYKAPKVYAYGKLVLWTMNKQTKPSLKLLANSKIKHIALANPATAPYGFAAIEVLKKHQLYNKVKDKLVFGESISQTNQFITLQSAEVGFTAMSVVMSPTMKDKGTWVEVDKKNYTPIEQGIVIIKHKGLTNPSALKFYDFLFSEKAQSILKDYGYDI